MGQWVWAFAFGALAYAMGAMALAAVAARVMGRRVPLRMWPAVFLALVFLFLTQHPFPEPDTLVCPVASAQPNLDAFAWKERAGLLWQRGVGPVEWVQDRLVAASAMNFLFCAAIGIAAAYAGLSTRRVLVAGAALSLLAELSQLTGIWGIYPCAYRQFNVDDLLLNTLGAWAGALAWHVGVGRRGA